MAFNAWQQYREVDTPAFNVVCQGDDDDTHIDIEVSHDEDGGLEAKVTIYNIGESRWNELEEGDPFQVDLGYLDEIILPQINGEIEEFKPVEDDGADSAYTFVGPDASEKRLSENYLTETWQEPSVGRVLRDIADLAGLRPGRVDTPTGIIGDSWSIGRSSPLSKHCDRLAEVAEDLAEEKYEWYASRGKIHFVPKADGGDAELNELFDGEAGNVLDIHAAEGKEKKSDGGTNLEFEALLDPQIEKDALVAVRTENYRGAYRVANYDIESNASDGRHRMSGELVPTDGEYALAENAPGSAPAQQF